MSTFSLPTAQAGTAASANSVNASQRYIFINDGPFIDTLGVAVLTDTLTVRTTLAVLFKKFWRVKLNVYDTPDTMFSLGMSITVSVENKLVEAALMISKMALVFVPGVLVVMSHSMDFHDRPALPVDADMSRDMSSHEDIVAGDEIEGLTATGLDALVMLTVLLAAYEFDEQSLLAQEPLITSPESDTWSPILGKSESSSC